MRRRDFLKNSAVVALPLAFPDISMFSNPGISQAKNLVLIQLEGGNDAYNTLVPFADKEYYKHRPALAVPADEVLPLNDYYGFNPAMSALLPHYRNANILLVNQIVFNTIEYSHYTAERIWKTAGSLSRESTWLERLQQTMPETMPVKIINAKQIVADKSINPSFEGEFSQDLSRIAQYIQTSDDQNIFTAKLDGFDTHQFQRYKHDALLEKYSTALSSLIIQLKNANKFDNTLILTWSEFGRTFRQNTKKGTDHANNNLVLIAGGRLRTSGVLNENPLQKKEISYLDIYATIIEKWFYQDPYSVLSHRHKVMNWI